MSPHHQHRRKTKYKSPSNNNAQTDEFLVFGYSAKLHNPCNELCPADDQQVFDENLYLIPWNGDDRLKIDRYDVRLYLSSLDEFDEKGQQKRGFLDNGGDEEEEGDKAEKLEEELCEEERFLDLYEDIRKRELEDANQKRGKGAEFGFIYEERDPEIGMVDVCEEATAEDERPYEQPPSLKLPLGIITPETMKQNAIIERTAQFVVLQGPQMEVVIKAKQRQNAEQFEFLDFDHRLHPYYKYMCKLIREKKYVPQPKQQLTKKKIVNDPSESESEIDSENEGDGYLHPSLLGGTSKAKADENALTKLGFIGPSPRPPPQKKEQKPASPVPDLDILVQQFHRSSNSNSLYSSLLKGLHSVLPGTSPKIDSAEKFDGEPSAAHVEENIPNIESVCIPSLFKTDQQQRSDDYNKWHMEFYGRPSPFLPGLPPVCQRPVPDSAVESAISVAAKYVALHGAYAEQRLIDHNQDKVHFLQARSPYYTFYQSQVRQIQWKIFHQSQQYRQQPFPVAPLFATTIGSVAAVPSPPPLSAVDLVAMSSQKPMAPAIEQKDDTEAKETEPDPKQLERREKARLFMEKILNERMAEKHRTKIKSNNFEENRDTGADSTTSLSATVSVQPIPSSTLSPLALSKAISTLIDEQIKRSLGTSPPHSPEERKKKSAKRTHDEERIRRKKKKRGRSHSFHSSSSSSTSSTSTASNKDTERSRKRRKSSRRRKRRRDHGSERDSGEGEKEERRQRRKRKHNGEEENSSSISHRCRHNRSRSRSPLR